MFFEGKKGDIEVEVALQYNDGYQESVFSFANNINTREGGTHLTGFRAALTGQLSTYAEKNGYLKDLQGGVTGGRRPRGPLRRRLGAPARSAVRGQTKAKLGNTRPQGPRAADRQREAGPRPSRKIPTTRARSSTVRARRPGARGRARRPAS